jgi:8-oxo-dGTP pyrophosphatase MutT (NUDIX family)
VIVIEAAGGLVERDGLVLVAHRPMYDDWTLPKGKLDRTDADLQACALREVWEETGYRCATSGPSMVVQYAMDSTRDKRVTYWRMTVLDGQFVPNSEVDEVRWLAPSEALFLLTYEQDHAILNQLLR